MQTTIFKRSLATIACAATVALGSACTPAENPEGGAPTEGGGEGGQTVSRDCDAKEGAAHPWAYVIERGDVDCDGAASVMDEYIAQGTEKDADVEGYTCSTVLLDKDNGGHGTNSMDTRYHFCSDDNGNAIRTITPDAQGLEGTYVHTPDFLIEDGLEEPSYFFKTAENGCEITMQEAGCVGAAPGHEDDEADMPGLVWLNAYDPAQTGVASDPQYTPMGSDQEAKELKPGEVIYAYNFACKALDDGGVECKRGDNSFTTTADSLD